MAHFAQLDNNNQVLRVIVVHNNELLDENGNESEQKGIDFCIAHYGGRWIQTSYNHTFRHKYAGKGDIYDPVRDVFYKSQPYPSWTFDEDALIWVAPKEQPGIRWTWDETRQEWIAPSS